MAVKPIQTVDPDDSRKKRRKKEKPQPKNWLHGIWLNWIKPIGLAVLVVFAFRWTIADWNDVPSSSMEPTILIGDRIFVNKLAYHLKFPFTDWKIAQWSEPDRGDVIVFFGWEVVRNLNGDSRYPVLEAQPDSRTLVLGPNAGTYFEPGDDIKVYAESTTPLNGTGRYEIESIETANGRTAVTVNRDIEPLLERTMMAKGERRRLVKRVIGVPGDIIELRDNVLFLNGSEVGTGEIDETTFRQLDLANMDISAKAEAEFFLEQSGDVMHPVMLDARGAPFYQTFGPVTVPEGYCFAMGDNRNNSADSRSPTLGFVPLDAVSGRAFGVAFSFDKDPTFRIRWERLLRGFKQESVE